MNLIESTNTNLLNSKYSLNNLCAIKQTTTIINRLLWIYLKKLIGLQKCWKGVMDNQKNKSEIKLFTKNVGMRPLRYAKANQVGVRFH